MITLLLFAVLFSSNPEICVSSVQAQEQIAIGTKDPVTGKPIDKDKDTNKDKDKDKKGK